MYVLPIGLELRFGLIYVCPSVDTLVIKVKFANINQSLSNFAQSPCLVQRRHVSFKTMENSFFIRSSCNLEERNFSAHLHKFRFRLVDGLNRGMKYGPIFSKINRDLHHSCMLYSAYNIVNRQTNRQTSISRHGKCNKHWVHLLGRSKNIHKF